MGPATPGGFTPLSKRFFVTTAPLSLALIGCAHVGTVRERAAFDLDCAADAVQVTEARGLYRAQGCGRSARYDCKTEQMESHCQSAAASPRAPADADVPSGWTSQSAAINRAVIDLACAKEKLDAVTLDPRSVGVRGCHKRISYVCHQRFWRYWCDADSPIRGEQP